MTENTHLDPDLEIFIIILIPSSFFFLI